MMPPHSPTPKPDGLARTRGFTLIELLIVIAIIAVLASLILAVVGKVQASSRTVKCANNLRQIGAGMIAFAGDNNMVLPAGSTWDKDISSYLGITSYKAAAAVLTCPEDKRVSAAGANQFPRSYTTNGVNAGSPNESYGMFSDTALAGSRRLNIIRGASTILVLEYFTGSAVANYQFQTPFAWTTPYLTASVAPRLTNGNYYHGATENYLFADGHVATLDPAVPCTKGSVLWEAW